MDFRTRIMLTWRSVNRLEDGVGERYQYQVRWRVRPGMLLWRRGPWTSHAADASTVAWTECKASLCRVKLRWNADTQPFQDTALQLQLVAAPRTAALLGRLVHRHAVAYAEVPFARLMQMPRQYRQSYTLGVALHERSPIVHGSASPYRNSELWFSFSNTIQRHEKGLAVLF